MRKGNPTMSTEYNPEIHTWFCAIEAAETWRDVEAKPPKGKRPRVKRPKVKRPKKTSDLSPLVKLLCSGASVPEAVREELEDLLTRHRLKATGNRRPLYAVSESEVDARTLMWFVKDFRSQRNFPRGAITKDEMKRATAVMQARASARGQANKNFDGMTAARDLREERIETYADYYGITDLKQFKNALEGKLGSINRIKSRKLQNE
jgi:hypothetical protein